MMDDQRAVETQGAAQFLGALRRGEPAEHDFGRVARNEPDEDEHHDGDAHQRGDDGQDSAGDVTAHGSL